VDAVLESIGEVYYVLDSEWRLVMLNAAAEAFIGRSRSEILGRTLGEVFPNAATASPFSPLLERAMYEGEAGRMIGPSNFRPGRTLDLRAAPLGAGAIGVFLTDVTERVAAEQAMTEYRERLELAVGAHQIGIYDWDVPSGRVVWSPELEAIFGLDPGTFEGTPETFQSRVLPEDFARATAESEAAMAHGLDLIKYDFRIRRADRAIRWVEGAARVMFDKAGAPQRIVGTNVDVTDRKAAEQHQQLLINELNHRVKNTLAIVQAIAWQSFRAGGMSKAARDSFEGRLAALAAAHDVLNRQNWVGGSIGQIIAVAVAPHDPGDGRMTLAGPAVQLEPKTAVALALAMHELATNAVKYGALSGFEGRVDVRWATEEGVLRLCWRETGGPPPIANIRPGFGVRLLKQGLAGEFGGAVSLDFRPEGLLCTIEAMLDAGPTVRPAAA